MALNGIVRWKTLYSSKQTREYDRHDNGWEQDGDGDFGQQTVEQA
jgi:hypothetical protein